MGGGFRGVPVLILFPAVDMSSSCFDEREILLAYAYAGPAVRVAARVLSRRP